jgi:tetratricopeptide (TPR) repeat protein
MGDQTDAILRAVAATPDEAPTRIAHFRIVEKLGAGGMGVVYRAHDESLRRDVALKLLPGGATEDDERKQRFLREARAAARITDPNVAVVHQVGEADGRVYIAMELVEGESLRTRLSRGKLDAATALDVATQIARGLAAAHERGIVHRDLKPENVMITKTGVIKLLDFGLAKPHQAAHVDVGSATTETVVTESGRLMGTPAYMSPEQATGGDVDVRTDIFSFGVVLYEMLSGVRPFDGQSVGAVLVAIARDTPRPLRELVTDVDARTVAIVEKCLAKSPDERFASCAELLAALSRAPIATPPPRNLSMRLALALALAVIAVIGGSRLVARRDDAPKAEAPAAATDASNVVRITDLPPPRTNVPEAATEYRQGIQAVRDNTWVVAAAHFGRAVQLDPSMAEAHLRFSMMLLPVRDAAMRCAEFERAAGMRNQLSERDQALMEAVQPFLQERVQDVGEADKRLRALAKRRPRDVEVWMWLAMIHYFTPAMKAPTDEMLALDPTDPVAWEFRADSLVLEGNLAGAREAFENCARHSIDGADCWAIRGWVERSAGQCVEFEKAARRAVDRSPFWLILEIPARASTGASVESLEEMATQLVPALPPQLGPEVHRLSVEARLAILRGDFTRAGALASEAAAKLGADMTLRSVYWNQLQTTALLLDVALETGDAAATQRIAGDFVARSDAWLREGFVGQNVDLSFLYERLALPADVPPPPAFEARRKKWIDARIAAGAYRGAVFSYAYAMPALTEPEARQAASALAELGPASSVASLGAWGPACRLGSPLAATGRLHLLTGKLDEAIASLRAATASCDLYDSTIDHVRASLDLGRALEQKGDKIGACEAYGAVLARWGHAKPKSVTADAARARAKVLGCALAP